jgi:hypothetical protein
VAITVDVEFQLIDAADIVQGNGQDQKGAFDLVVATEEDTGMPVELIFGDCAYGGGASRSSSRTQTVSP